MPESVTDGDSHEVTRLLRQLSAGRDGGADRLIALLFDSLHAAADKAMKGQPASHTLQPTALVHEAYLKLIRYVGGIENRGHFLAVASRVMRQILVDHARGRIRLKRGGNCRPSSLDRIVACYEDRQIDVLTLNDLLVRLARLDTKLAALVELRVFGGLTMHEAAKQLGLALRTAERHWAFARAWLKRELDDDAERE